MLTFSSQLLPCLPPLLLNNQFNRTIRLKPTPPHEDDYDDPVCYKCDCKKYEDAKLKVLNKWDAWAKQEQMADAEHAAITA